MNQRKILIGLLALVWTLSCATQTLACTSWLAAGDRVSGGGTLIVKNRDWFQGDITELKLMKSNRGFAYFVLFANQGGSGNRGGINEAGLVALTLSPPSFGPNKRDGDESFKSFDTDWVLNNYRTVEETLQALKTGQWQTYAHFVVLSDAEQIAYIEFGPGGKYAVQKAKNGVLIHANHYQEPSMLHLNPQKPATAASAPPATAETVSLDPAREKFRAIAMFEIKRYLKAKEQMNSKESFSFLDMKSFSQDPTVWYDHPKEMRTYATFAVYQRPHHSPLIWVKLSNPGEPVREAQFTLAEAMSGKALSKLK